ncbi:MAG: hypothetical protein LBO05_08125 [Deltaproteobacteria bacterium]|jgi:hypothetical protein|nr:hypothetical protein [Deltaproteobacteria bacterium]
MLESYKPSGKYDASAYYLVPAVNALASTATGLAYVLFVFHNPFRIVHVVALFAWPAATAIFGWKAICKARCRSKTMAGYLAAAGGFVGWYLSWCLWACLLAKRACAPAGFLEIADSPKQLWAAVKTAGSAGA